MALSMKKATFAAGNFWHKNQNALVHFAVSDIPGVLFLTNLTLQHILLKHCDEY